MTRAYQLCLFDLDGTLSDPRAGIFASFRHALGRFGIEERSEERLRSFIGPTLRETFEAQYGFDSQQATDAIAAYREYFGDRGLFENTMFEPVPNLLRELRAQGTKIALATTKPEVYARRILAHFGIAGLFDAVAGAELSGARSDKEELIRHALAQLDLLPSPHMCMVGDRVHDMEGAHKVGIDALAVTWGNGSRAELEGAQAHAIFDEWEPLRDRLLLNLRPGPTSC